MFVLSISAAMENTFICGARQYLGNGHCSAAMNCKVIKFAANNTRTLRFNIIVFAFEAIALWFRCGKRSAPSSSALNTRHEHTIGTEDAIPPLSMQTLLYLYDAEIPTFWIASYLFSGVCVCLLKLESHRPKVSEIPIIITTAARGTSSTRNRRKLHRMQRKTRREREERGKGRALNRLQIKLITFPCRHSVHCLRQNWMNEREMRQKTQKILQNSQ